MAFVIWLTGLPGSGKSGIGRHLVRLLVARSRRVVRLEMDRIRTLLVDQPKYDEGERDLAYRCLATTAIVLYENGINVVIDATAHRRRWRDFTRQNISNFVEVYVKCPINTCIERESRRKQHPARQRIYLDALDRLKTGEKVLGLGDVPGVDVEYEEPQDPEITVESDKFSSEQIASMILNQLRNRFGIY